MGKTLVTFFSATGVTARLAKSLAQATGADLYQIQPQTPYTKADLDWKDRRSRSSVEMSDPTYRPQIIGSCHRMEDYDTIFVGFPIWWYVAPTIVNTFLESYDLSGKTIIPFATSGGSPMGKTDEALAPSCPGARLLPGRVLKASASQETLTAWVQSLEL